VKFIEEKFGKSTASWKWGELHHQHFPHAFSNTPFAFIFERKVQYRGNRRTVGVSSYLLDESFDGTTGSNYK
jgi:acyl-homoserine lactone acylase PvdQ